jgi:hypothetical protein
LTARPVAAPSGSYPEPMFASFTPAQSVALTFVTSRLIIQGTVETRVRRVADIFNEADVTHLILTNAVFLEIGSRRVVAQAAVAQIPLEDILFAHPSGPTEGASEMRVPKQAVRATLLLPPFTIDCQIHLAYESELRIAMQAYEGRFMPVTAAKYWAYGVAESPIDVDLLLVNHARSFLAVPTVAGWQSEAPQSESTGHRSNTW